MNRYENVGETVEGVARAGARHQAAEENVAEWVREYDTGG